MAELTRREAMAMASLAGMAAIGANAEGAQPRAQRGDDDATSGGQVIYGIHPVFTPADFILECNCNNVEDPAIACHPTCCIILPRRCVARLWPDGRCCKLPGHPVRWRVRLVPPCRVNTKAKGRQAGDVQVIQLDACEPTADCGGESDGESMIGE